MKRAKYALGAIALIAGVAGTFAFKAHKAVAKHFYYLGTTSSDCKYVTLATTTNKVGAPTSFVVIEPATNLGTVTTTAKSSITILSEEN
jgi:hypothetical protein